jgi:hypothetical protein
MKTTRESGIYSRSNSSFVSEIKAAVRFPSRPDESDCSRRVSTAWSSVLLGPMKDNIIELCNSQLARRSSTQPDEPLVRGYTFLRSFLASLSYECNILTQKGLQSDWP